MSFDFKERLNFCVFFRFFFTYNRARKRITTRTLCS